MDGTSVTELGKAQGKQGAGESRASSSQLCNFEIRVRHSQGSQAGLCSMDRARPESEHLTQRRHFNFGNCATSPRNTDQQEGRGSRSEAWGPPKFQK